MTALFAIIWGILLIASIAWYAFLVLFLGVRAGRELRDLTRDHDKAPKS